MLTEKQLLFCKCYVSNMNATKAATMAGYSEKTAYSQGQRLLKNAEVKAAIRDALDELDAALPDKNELRRFWAEVMRNEQEKTSARLTASGYLAKSLFMFDSDYWEE